MGSTVGEREAGEHNEGTADIFSTDEEVVEEETLPWVGGDGEAGWNGLLRVEIMRRCGFRSCFCLQDRFQESVHSVCQWNSFNGIVLMQSVTK